MPLYAATEDPEIVIDCPLESPEVLATVYVATEPVPVIPVIATGVTVTPHVPKPVVATPPVADKVEALRIVKVVVVGTVLIVNVPLYTA